MSQFLRRVHWLDACDVSSSVSSLEPDWDIVVTNPYTEIVIRVMRPVLAGLITIIIAHVIADMQKTAEKPVSRDEILVRIPAA